jgi:hypothetical protein
LDMHQTFQDHVNKSPASAHRTVVVVGRLIANIGGSLYTKRQPLMSVINSKFLYGASVWALVVEGMEKSHNTYPQIQLRAVLRVTRCYRTVSDKATLILAKMSLAHLLTMGRARVKEIQRNKGNIIIIKRQEHKVTLEK